MTEQAVSQPVARFENVKGYLSKLDALAAELNENLRKLQDALRGNPQAGAKAEALAQEAQRAFAAYDVVVRRASAELAAGSSRSTPKRPMLFTPPTKITYTPQKKIWKLWKPSLWSEWLPASANWPSKRAAQNGCC